MKTLLKGEEKMSETFSFIKPPELIRRTNLEDIFEKRICNLIVPWDKNGTFDVGILMVPFSRAGRRGDSGASAAPNAIRQAFTMNTTYSPDFDVDLQSLNICDIGDVSLHTTDILQSHSNIRCALEEIYQHTGEPLMICVGGDHSISCPLVEGYSNSHPNEKIGIIHFDAHNDVRDFQNGGPTNGTPIRGIIEGPANVAGENICQVGIHGFMNSSYYKKYCDEKKVRVISSREVRKKGIEKCMEEAIRIASNNTDSIYVTVDIDVLSLPYAFGTGAPSAEGLNPWDLLEAIFLLGQNPNVRAMDLVCIDPIRDFRDYTSRMGASIICTFLGGFIIRKTGGKGY